MRIIHTADWHLGRLFYGIHLTEDQSYVLDQLVEVLQDTRADLLIVAGDIYDRAVPPPDAVTLLDQTLSRIALDCRIPVVMISGNHDSADRLGFGSRLLKSGGLQLFSTPSHDIARVTFGDQHGPLDVYALPYAEPPSIRQLTDVETVVDHDSATRTLLERVHPMNLNSRRSILVAHLMVQGGIGSESERPLNVREDGSVSPTRFRGFRYVALGHLHRCQTVANDPRICYAGSPMKYSFSERNDQKSVTLLEIDADQVTSQQIPLSAKHDLRQLTGNLAELIAAATDDPSTTDYLKITLTDSGPILDPMGQLRRVYPNTLHIERTLPLATATDLPSLELAQRSESIGDRQLFEAFYQQVAGSKLDDELAPLLDAAIEEVQAIEAER
ncbi:MAG: exonuclease SbcCD subunit D [Deltaproteobacteria bacterium]|nr:exonuclease SbcCD subunit D [Deltaproteobacteria bacterium]